jgi:hypothetical protein
VVATHLRGVTWVERTGLCCDALRVTIGYKSVEVCREDGTGAGSGWAGSSLVAAVAAEQSARPRRALGKAPTATKHVDRALAVTAGSSAPWVVAAHACGGGSREAVGCGAQRSGLTTGGRWRAERRLWQPHEVWWARWSRSCRRGQTKRQQCLWSDVPVCARVEASIEFDAAARRAAELRKQSDDRSGPRG